MQLRSMRLQLVAAGARLAAAGLIDPGEGNLSLRIDERHCLLTPRGVDKGRLSAPQLVVSAIKDSTAAAGASSEARVHCAIYRAYAPVAAVVHAHPPTVLRLAARNLAPDCGLLLEAAQLLPGIGWVGRLEPGTAALAAAVVEAIRPWPGCVLDGHGALTVGASLGEAMRRMLLAERLALVTEAAAGR